jgi:hypothetical protein
MPQHLRAELLPTLVIQGADFPLTGGLPMKAEKFLPRGRLRYFRRRQLRGNRRPTSLAVPALALRNWCGRTSCFRPLAHLADDVFVDPDLGGDCTVGSRRVQPEQSRDQLASLVRLQMPAMDILRDDELGEVFDFARIGCVMRFDAGFLTSECPIATIHDHVLVGGDRFDLSATLNVAGELLQLVTLHERKHVRQRVECQDLDLVGVAVFPYMKHASSFF